MGTGFGDAAGSGDRQWQESCAPALLQDSAKRSSSFSQDMAISVKGAKPEAERRAAQAWHSRRLAVLVALPVRGRCCLREAIKPSLGDTVMDTQLLFTAGRVKFCLFILVAIITAQTFI